MGRGTEVLRYEAKRLLAAFADTEPERIGKEERHARLCERVSVDKAGNCDIITVKQSTEAMQSSVW